MAAEGRTQIEDSAYAHRSPFSKKPVVVIGRPRERGGGLKPSSHFEKILAQEERRGPEPRGGAAPCPIPREG